MQPGRIPLLQDHPAQRSCPSHVTGQWDALDCCCQDLPSQLAHPSSLRFARSQGPRPLICDVKIQEAKAEPFNVLLIMVHISSSSLICPLMSFPLHSILAFDSCKTWRSVFLHVRSHRTLRLEHLKKKIFFCFVIGVELLYNVVLVSAGQQRDSGIGIHISPPTPILPF